MGVTASPVESWFDRCRFGSCNNPHTIVIRLQVVAAGDRTFDPPLGVSLPVCDTHAMLDRSLPERLRAAEAVCEDLVEHSVVDRGLLVKWRNLLP